MHYDYIEVKSDHDPVRVGPLGDRVVIGSDEQRADIILDQSLQLPPILLVLERVRDGVFVVRTEGQQLSQCTIMPARGSDQRPRKIRDGVRVQAGDAVAVSHRRQSLVLELKRATPQQLTLLPTIHDGTPEGHAAASAAPTTAPSVEPAPEPTVPKGSARRAGSQNLAWLRELNAYRLGGVSGTMLLGGALTLALLSASLIILAVVLWLTTQG